LSRTAIGLLPIDPAPNSFFLCIANLHERNINQRIAARHGNGHGGNDLGHMGLNQAPPALTQNHNRDFSDQEILLIAQIFVRRHQHVKTSKPAASAALSSSPFFQFVPATGAGFRNGVVVDQVAGKGARGTVIKKNQH
jgi:hypothetical protein